MSDSVAGGCLIHYDNRHIQVRRDFFDLCAYKKEDYNQNVTKNGKKAKDEPNQECMAKILRLLETLTDHKKTEWHLKAEQLKAKGLKISAEPKEYRIELAYSTIAKYLYGTYGESTVRKSIAVLLERDYIKRYQATKNSVPCYVLNIPVLQKALASQAQESMGDTEVSNLTPDSSTPDKDKNEVSNLTARPSNLTPEIPSSNFEVSNLTPNNIDKKETKTTKERKNGGSHQSSTVSTQQESSHSFNQSQSSLVSSQQTKPEEKQEVVFSPEAEQVYALATDLNITCLKRNDEHRGNCMHLASKGVTTQEQMKSLMQHCWQKSYLKDKDLNLKNLINELPGWLQLQRRTSAAPSTDVVTSVMGKATVGLLEIEEKHKQKILEQEATQGKPKKTPSERYAELLASKKSAVSTSKC